MGIVRRGIDAYRIRMLCRRKKCGETQQELCDRKVSISDIESIRSSSSVDVVYTQASGTPYAEIYAPDNIVPLVKVEQDGKDLKIGFKSNTSIQGRYKCEVRVFAPEVTSFSTSSASDITLANGLKTSKPVTLKASSSGDIDASSVQCGDLSMTTSSSGDIKVGTIACGMLALDTQSSGDIKVTSATCTGADIESSSAGDCIVGEMACSGDVKASTSLRATSSWRARAATLRSVPARREAFMPKTCLPRMWKPVLLRQAISNAMRAACFPHRCRAREVCAIKASRHVWKGKSKACRSFDFPYRGRGCAGMKAQCYFRYILVSVSSLISRNLSLPISGCSSGARR